MVASPVFRGSSVGSYVKVTNVGFDDIYAGLWAKKKNYLPTEVLQILSSEFCVILTTYKE